MQRLFCVFILIVISQWRNGVPRGPVASPFQIGEEKEFLYPLKFH